MSPSLMALLPLDRDVHQSSPFSQYLSRMESSRVELFRTLARTTWLQHNNRPAALSQAAGGGELLMTLMTKNTPVKHTEPVVRRW